MEAYQKLASKFRVNILTPEDKIRTLNSYVKFECTECSKPYISKVGIIAYKSHFLCKACEKSGMDVVLPEEPETVMEEINCPEHGVKKRLVNGTMSCPKCVDMSEKMDICKETRKKLIAKNVFLMDEYQDTMNNLDRTNKTYIKFIHKCRHCEIILTTPHTEILKEDWCSMCKDCVSKLEQKNTETVRNYIESYNCRLLNSRVPMDMRQPINLQCSCGSEFKITFKEFKKIKVQYGVVDKDCSTTQITFKRKKTCTNCTN